MTEDIFIPGKFTDLSNPHQLAILNDILYEMLGRLNQIDPNSIALAWLQGDVAGKVIASKGTGNSPEWDATPTLTGATFSGLTASALVATDSNKALTSDTSNYIIGNGVNRITVGPDEPTSPEVGDLWIDTDA